MNNSRLVFQTKNCKHWIYCKYEIYFIKKENLFYEWFIYLFFQICWLHTKMNCIYSYNCMTRRLSCEQIRLPLCHLKTQNSISKRWYIVKNIYISVNIYIFGKLSIILFCFLYCIIFFFYQNYPIYAMKQTFLRNHFFFNFSFHLLIMEVCVHPHFGVRLD